MAYKENVLKCALMQILEIKSGDAVGKSRKTLTADAIHSASAASKITDGSTTEC